MNKDRRKQIEALMTRIDNLDKGGQDIIPIGARQAVIFYHDKFREAAEAMWEEMMGFVEQLKEEAGELRDEAETIRDEEQEYYDNMPEGLQSADKGQNAEAAVSALEAAHDKLSEIADFEIPGFADIELPDVQEFLNSFDEARGSLEEAVST
jgi:hypothetical protein